MAKMFYTMAESMQKLRCSEGVIRVLIKEGRLREFRDGPRLMFKTDQVEDIARMGIPPTFYPTMKLSDDFGAGSGSGLLDLARKSDDTILGAELLNEIIDPRKKMKQEMLDKVANNVNAKIVALKKPKKHPFLKALFFVVCLLIAYAAGFITCLVMGSH